MVLIQNNQHRETTKREIQGIEEVGWSEEPKSKHTGCMKLKMHDMPVNSIAPLKFNYITKFSFIQNSTRVDE